jgi:hypothetical protein
MPFAFIDVHLRLRPEGPRGLLKLESPLHGHALIGAAVEDEHRREAPHPTG